MSPSVRRAGRFAAAGIGILLCALVAVVSARAALLINENLYDPEGPDRGAEWVEIHNTGP